MGAYFETIPKSLVAWILDQKVFWVATAPLSGAGHVNVSPKGGPCFGLTDEKTFWYLDMTGSGSETASHLYEPNNGRITVMFNAFVGPPRIVRLFGHGSVLEHGAAEFDDFVKKNDVSVVVGTRSIIIVDIHQVSTSCGFSVPFYDFRQFRSTLKELSEGKQRKFEAGDEKESFPRYWAHQNAYSVDGLPSYRIGLETAQKEKIEPVKKMTTSSQALTTYRKPPGSFTLGQLLLAVLVGAVVSAALGRYAAPLLHVL